MAKATNPHKNIKFLPHGTKRCPHCGHQVQTINRITGYLSYAEGDESNIQNSKGVVKNRFQKGKLDELKNRTSHVNCSCEK